MSSLLFVCDDLVFNRLFQLIPKVLEPKAQIFAVPALALKYGIDFTEQDHTYIVIFSDINGIQVDMDYSKVFLVLFVFDNVVYAIYSND